MLEGHIEAFFNQLSSFSKDCVLKFLVNIFCVFVQSGSKDVF